MELYRYQRADGSEPFSDWLKALGDKQAKARIRFRLQRLEAGHFGDTEPVGDGVFELRLHFGPGYRVYFGRQGKLILLLLCGGDKSTQTRDIMRAKDYWAAWKAMQS
jgi:putative addiction module killer protein